MSQSRYEDLCKAFADARASFGAYRSECFFFAATFTRGFADYSGWPRENTSYENVAAPDAAPTQRIEEAMRLDADGFWAFGLRLSLDDAKGKGSVLVRVRFKKLETRYIISLYGFEDFEVAAPTPEALQPIYDSILNAVRRHFAYGLRLFLENGGRGLKIPITADQLAALGAPVRAEGAAAGAAKGPDPVRARPAKKPEERPAARGGKEG
jgi:hypothetical protein